MSPALDAVWADVEVGLRASLRAAGLDASAVDDVVQEVALRVIDRSVAFDSAEDLLRWCRVVGRRLAIDEHRRRRRSVSLSEAVDVAGTVDVETTVVARARARQVLGAVRRLAPADRVALVALPTLDADRKEQVRLAVRRHRARARLAAIVDGVAALLGWLVVRRRRPSPLLAGLAMAPAVTGLLLLPSQAPHVLDLPPQRDGGPGLATAVVPSDPTAVADPAAASGASDRTGQVDDEDDRDRPGRRRPVRKAIDRLRDGEPDATIRIDLPGEVDLVELPAIEIGDDRPRILPDLDVEVDGLVATLR